MNGPSFNVSDRNDDTYFDHFFRGNRGVERCSNYDIYDIRIGLEFCSCFDLI